MALTIKQDTTTSHSFDNPGLVIFYLLLIVGAVFFVSFLMGRIFR